MSWRHLTFCPLLWTFRHYKILKSIYATVYFNLESPNDLWLRLPCWLGICSVSVPVPTWVPNARLMYLISSKDDYLAAIMNVISFWHKDIDSIGIKHTGNNIFSILYPQILWTKKSSLLVFQENFSIID